MENFHKVRKTKAEFITRLDQSTGRLDHALRDNFATADDLTPLDYLCGAMLRFISTGIRSQTIDALTANIENVNRQIQTHLDQAFEQFEAQPR